MKLIVDEQACEKHGLTFKEFLVLYLSFLEVNYKETLNNLINKEIVSRDLFNPDSAVLSNNSKILLSDIIVDSNKDILKQDTRFKELAVKLRDIYIPGKRPNSQDYYKGTVPEITDKLKKFFIEYGEYGDFTDEAIIEATKKYVESFNGDYTFAQLLKYFICKRVEGEKGSRLLNYLANSEEEDSLNNAEWETTLK